MQAEGSVRSPGHSTDRSIPRTSGRGVILLEGKPIGTADIERLRSCFFRHGKRLWCYYVPFLCCYSLPPRRVVEVAEWGGATWLLARSDGRRGKRVDLVVPPLPFSLDIWPEAVAWLTDQNGRPPRILWSDERDRDIGEKAGMTAEAKDADYIYDPGEVADLAGRHYRDVRKRVRRFERSGRIEFRNLRPEDVSSCQSLLAAWRRLQGRRHPFLLDWGYTRASLDRFEDWSVEALRGWCLERDGELAGFALAGPLAADEACFFVAKSDPTVPGTSEYLRVRVCDHLREFTYLNDAGDLGLPGLRQYKRKLRPVTCRPVFTLTSQG